MLKALIFDMDGVLVDSMPYHADAWIQVFSEVGIQINRQDIYDIEGSNHEGVIRLIFEKAGRSPPEDFRELAMKKREVFEKINKVKAFNGINETLSLLKKKYIFGVVSGSDRAIVTGLIDRFFPGIFDVVISGNDVKHGKPSPEPYIKAMEMLKVHSEECIAVENAPLGVESVKEAGIYCIAIPTYINRSRLKNADMVLDDHTVLMEYLEKLM